MLRFENKAILALCIAGTLTIWPKTPNYQWVFYSASARKFMLHLGVDIVYKQRKRKSCTVRTLKFFIRILFGLGVRVKPRYIQLFTLRKCYAYSYTFILPIVLVLFLEHYLLIKTYQLKKAKKIAPKQLKWDSKD